MTATVRAVGAWLRRRKMDVRKPFGKGAVTGDIRLTLCDQNPDMADAWQWAFRDADSVEVVVGNLLDLECDALVSPANSFGDMGGGIDKAIDDFYGGAAQERTMRAIREQYLGELPVGTAVVHEMPGARRFPYLVTAPTMRVPRDVAGTLNAYLAMRGALVAVVKHNGNAPTIRTLAVSGLCTGVGGMDVGTAAEQMRAAYDNVLGGGWERVVHPAMAPYAFDG